jgi:hypothetical protein
MRQRHKPVKQTAFRLTKEDLSILSQMQKALGLRKRTETLRFILRAYQQQVTGEKR